DIVIVGASDLVRDRLARHDAAIKMLARAEDVRLEDKAPKGSAQIVLGETTACLPLGGLIDVEAERARLEKSRAKTQSDIEKTRKKLDNPRFVENAKPDVVAAERHRLAELEPILDTISEALARIDEL
ncbi:MAG: valine--tRNA ligase, partial [Pseudomonadota bacterium]